LRALQRRGIKWLWMNCNGWWVLVQVLLSIFNNVCAGSIRGYFKDAANNWREKNNDNDFLHCTSTNPVGCTTKRKQI
jgi:hypothetical protein